MGNELRFGDVVQRAADMRERLVLAQQDLARATVTGTAAAGLISVTMLGDGTVTKVALDQAAVDANDAAALSALVLTAINRANDAVRALTTERMGALSDDVRSSLGVDTRTR